MVLTLVTPISMEKKPAIRHEYKTQKRHYETDTVLLCCQRVVEIFEAVEEA